MTEWLLRKIGVGDEFLVNLQDVSLAVQRPAVLWLLALLLPVGYFIYRRQRNNLVTIPTTLCGALTATRVIVLALLIFVMSGPYLKLEHESEKRPIVAVLLDQSQSMQLPAGPFDADADALAIAQAAGYQTPGDQVDSEARKALNRISRAKLAQTVLEHNADKLLKPLAEKYDLRLFAFDREVMPLGLDPKDPKVPEPSATGGPSSYLGDAIGQIVDEAGGRQLAGVLLVSDGQNTGGRSPADAAQAAAHINAPIYAIPSGVSTRKADLAIIDVFTSGLVSVGDTARVAVTLQSQGFNGRPIKVELKDGETVLDSKDLVLGNEQQQMELTFEAKEPGARYLTVAVPPQPEEPVELHSNNTDVAFVRVSDEKIKVLYVEGLPRWDFRFLKNAMRRDHGLGGLEADQPDILLEAEVRRRTDATTALPGDLDALATYHTVILGDVSADLLTSPFLELLGQAVRERGVGLVIAAGPHHMPHRYDASLTELLPVRLAKKAGGLEAEVYNPFRLELSPEGAIHEAMRLYDDTSRNQNVWSKMPPYFWSAATERASPAASVLASNPSVKGRYGALPLIAYHYAGQGKVMFVGTDSTWLWRQNVGDRFFYRFWGQSIRFVARRDEADSKKSRLEIRPLRAQPGEEAQIELMAFTPDGSPRTDGRLAVQVSGVGDAKTLQLIADEGVKGRYIGAYTPQKAGQYKIAFSPGGTAATVEAQFRVMVAPEEMRHPHVDRDALQRIADASNGRLVELTDLASIPPELQGETKKIQLRREATIWDNWLMLVLLVTVYSLDVGLRRLAGLS